MVKQWRDKWRKLGSGERLRVQVLIGALILAFYGGAIFPFSYKAYFEAGKMLHRRQDRIEKRTKIDTPPVSANPQGLRRQIEETDKKLKQIREGFNELDTGFAAVDSSDMRQHLMVEISTLAQRTRIELVTAARKGTEGRLGQNMLMPESRQDSEADTMRAALDPALGRPLLVLTATGQFEPLLAFLHGLSDLSFYVSPMQVRLYSRHIKDLNKRISGVQTLSGPDDGSLAMYLELSM